MKVYPLAYVFRESEPPSKRFGEESLTKSHSTNCVFLRLACFSNGVCLAFQMECVLDLPCVAPASCSSLLFERRELSRATRHSRVSDAGKF